VVALVYPNLTQLDFTGPAQVFAVAPAGRLELHVAAALQAPVPTDSGFALVPTCSFEQAPQADVLLVPGGVGVNHALQDPVTLGFVRRQAQAAQVVASVCTGALLLGAAGLLRGKRATSHWNSVDLLAQFGATPVRERVVKDGQLMTSAGVTAGLDLALTLLGDLFGADAMRWAALDLQYDPQPPATGNPANPVMDAMVAEGLKWSKSVREPIVERAAALISED
jgi:cyclohexyl-isocyanide hydratase